MRNKKLFLGILVGLGIFGIAAMRYGAMDVWGLLKVDAIQHLNNSYGVYVEDVQFLNNTVRASAFYKGDTELATGSDITSAVTTHNADGSAHSSAFAAKLTASNNLSDVSSASTARTNLGLGTAATQAVGTSAGNVVQLDGSAKLPAVDGSALTNLPASGESNTASNVGTGTGVFAQKSGVDLQFKSLIAGTNIEITYDSTGITIAATGSASGEANTASNIGAGGIGVFAQKSGVDLQFKNIIAGSNKLLVSDDTADSEIAIDVQPGNISHQDLSGAGTNTHTQIDSHIASTSNPHSVTAAQVGAVATSGDETIAGVKTFSSAPVGVTPTTDNELATKKYVDDNAGSVQTPQTLTDASTITWDMSSGVFGIVTLGGNRTLSNPTNIVAGSACRLIVKQDATGSRTLTFSSYYKFPGAVAPTLSVSASAVDIFEFIAESTTVLHCTNIIYDSK